MQNNNTLEAGAKAFAASATAAVVGAAGSILPDAFFQLRYFITKKQTSLTNQEEIKLFKELYDLLNGSCNPKSSAAQKLPTCIQDCWSCFSDFEVKGGNIHVFNSYVDLTKLTREYQSRTLRNARDYLDFPLTNAILTDLIAPKSIQSDATQSVAKIFFAYIGLVSLFLATLRKIEDIDIVAGHLLEVIELVAPREKFLTHFTSTLTLESFLSIKAKLNAFINKPHPIRDTARLPALVDDVGEHYHELLVNCFRLLLILTEGGRKDLSLDYSVIRTGQLTAKNPDIKFDLLNPYSVIILYVAKMIPEIKSMNDEIEMLPLKLGNLNQTTTFIEKHLTSGIELGNTRYQHDSPLLPLLEQKPREPGQNEVRWLKLSDQKDINSSAVIMHQLANWLRYLLYVTHMVTDIQVTIRDEGQRWFAKGNESKLIQDFFKQNYRLFSKFQDYIETLDNFLHLRLRTDAGSIHGVLGIIQDTKKRSRLLAEKLSELQDIKDQYLALEKTFAAAKRRFVLNAEHFIKCTGHVYGFKFAAIEAFASRAPSAAAVAAPQEAEDSQMLNLLRSIQLSFTEYARKHGYKFNLCKKDNDIRLQDANSPAETVRVEGKYQGKSAHLIRAQWIYKCFVHINSNLSQVQILKLLQNEIVVALTKQKKYFASRNVAPGIAEKSFETLISNMQGEIDTILIEIVELPEVMLDVPTPNDDDFGIDTNSTATSTSSNAFMSPNENLARTATPINMPFPEPEEVLSTDTPYFIKLDLWIKQFAATKDKAAQQAFLDFFKSLCLIKKPFFERMRPINRLKTFHTAHLLLQTKQTSRLNMLQEITAAAANKDNPAQQDWSSKAQLVIPESNVSNAPSLAANQINLRMTLTTTTANLNEFRNLHISHHPTDTLIWPLKEIATLKTTLIKFLQEDAVFSEIFLQTITAYITQKSGKSGFACLDQTMTVALTQYMAVPAEEQESLAIYWETIIQGLLVLGADPLPQLSKLNDLASVPMFMLNLASILFSHLLYRAPYLGETLLHMQTQLDEMMNDLEAFAALLYDCETSLLRRFTEKFTAPKGDRQNRTKLFCEVVIWIYHFLHDATVIKEMKPTTQMQTCSQKVEAALAAFDHNKDSDKWTKKASHLLQSLMKIRLNLLQQLNVAEIMRNRNPAPRLTNEIEKKKQEDMLKKYIKKMHHKKLAELNSQENKTALLTYITDTVVPDLQDTFDAIAFSQEDLIALTKNSFLDKDNLEEQQPQSTRSISQISITSSYHA